ncbi:uncharacterized protein I206_100898 [Kwoniella pini CBS 10737]|uniref:Uncharacterized protein n=1 Tax=Kwoniella pini CBS 10737 TaxID=1296096 RepID=A0A1B9ICE6_9TREE|nr:uncharacterized protein I206_00428 [Kwoniella pini CBS 10737]OCF53127.1 hypothetical protein I206_00428 [Kwoniella pini CBS 10737]
MSTASSSAPPPHLQFTLNLRAVPQDNSFVFDHDFTLDPPARQHYKAVEQLIIDSDASVIDWMKSSDGSAKYLSNRTRCLTDESGKTIISSESQDEIRSTLSERIEPLLQKYRDETSKIVEFGITFDTESKYGTIETALEPFSIPKGPGSSNSFSNADSSAQETDSTNSHGLSTGGWRVEEDEGGSNVSDEDRGSDYSVASSSYGPRTALLNAWRGSASISGTSGLEETSAPIPVESALVSTSKFPGDDVSSSEDEIM